jgi:hypothetical protein
MRAPHGRTKSRSVAAALAVLLACGMAACSSDPGGPSSDGPLSSGLKHGPIPKGSICVPGREGPQTFGDQIYTNYGHTTVVIDRVTLLDPHNQRLIGSYAVPGGEGVGAIHWPPTGSRQFPLPPGWKDRQPVHGFRLAPGKKFNMVIGVAAIRAGRAATSQGILVYYHDAAGSYVARNYFQNIIAATKTGCLSG